MFMAIFHPLRPPVSKTGSLCQTTTDRRQTESIMVHGLSNYLLPPDVSPAGLHTGAGGGLNTAFCPTGTITCTGSTIPTSKHNESVRVH